MDDRKGIANGITNLGSVALFRGDHAAARELFAESLALNGEIGDKLGILETLAGLAGVAAGEGQVLRAVSLAAGAGAFRSAHGLALFSVKSRLYDETIVSTRAALGEETFAHAWAAGEALPLEAVIALAHETVTVLREG
jgi:hypothetical protein